MGTETEALDADLKRSAAAKKQVLEKRFKPQRTLDAVADLDEFAVGQFFPTRADRGIVAEAVKKKLNLAEGEVHLAGETNEQDAVEGIR